MSASPLRAAHPASRRWLAPEVVQTSSMDCGPAALKCLLDGHGLPASYGRLREACQTDVDGTSIDTLEAVAQVLGLQAEQSLVPADHVALPGVDEGPSIAVVRLDDGGAHFVVVWRRLGPWLQLMDPALGRRWVRADRWREALYRHEHAVPAADWRAWAAGEAATAALRARLQALGVAPASARALVQQALADPSWFALGALDAVLRLATALVEAAAVPTGAAALRLVRATWQRTLEQPHDIHRHVGPAYWSVVPDAAPGQLRLRGAVVVQVRGRLPVGQAEQAESDDPLQAGLRRSAALKSVREERVAGAWSSAWRLLGESGRPAPLLLALAVVLATGALVFEALMFRGLFELSGLLALPWQRAAALAALLGFLAVLLLVEWPIAGESLRLGRQLDLRLRMALLDTLPRLSDRYFHSRPMADMADRSHGIQVVRGLPALVLQGLQVLAALGLTLVALVWLAPASAGWALALTAVAVALPLALQPLLNERDLRLRNQVGALGGFYLDALQGAVPVRAHRAQDSMRRQHEALLGSWEASMQGWIRLSLGADAVQGLVGTALAAGLVLDHFSHHAGVGGADLLLVYWALKLPALGRSLAGLAQQWPAQRNAVLRLMEPLSAPQEAVARATPASAAAGPRGVSLCFEGGRVVASGHEILRGLDLRIEAGEHVAVVGASGAGKSSLLGVLLGWHRLSEGRLRVDGQPLTDEGLAGLRAQTAWVDPAVHLWNRSLLDNLLYARDPALPADLATTLEAARLRGVAQRLPQGLQSPLGEGGACLSGGEGQRVRLGRALGVSPTRLVLLDEPFRGLDRGQRQALMREVREVWRGHTLLCVTHDVGETQAFDRVLVVDQGELVEDGPPDRLAVHDGPYRALLQAEDALRQGAWQDDTWRRLHLHDGRLREASPPRGSLPAEARR